MKEHTPFSGVQVAAVVAATVTTDMAGSVVVSAVEEGRHAFVVCGKYRCSELRRTLISISDLSAGEGARGVEKATGALCSAEYTALR